MTKRGIGGQAHKDCVVEAHTGESWVTNDHAWRVTSNATSPASDPVWASIDQLYLLQIRRRLFELSQLPTSFVERETTKDNCKLYGLLMRNNTFSIGLCVYTQALAPRPTNHSVVFVDNCNDFNTKTNLILIHFCHFPLRLLLPPTLRPPPSRKAHPLT